VSIRGLISLCAVVVGLTPTVLRAEGAVRIAPEAASLFVHEPFALRLEVESEEPPQAPRLPSVTGLAVIAVRSLPPEAGSPMHRFEIGLIAEEPSLLVVPPFPVQVDGQTVWTSAVPLEILAPRPATEMTLAMTVQPAALRVGQPATVTMTWTSAVPLDRCKQLLLEIPLLADPRCQFFPLDPPGPEAERVGLPVNSVRVFAATGVLPDRRQSLTFRYALVPLQPCVLHAPAGRFMCALLQNDPSSGQPPGYMYNHFFDVPEDKEAYERVYLALPAPEITVRALPESGRTARYAGIVGPCDFRTSLSPTQLAVGQPALLTVHLDHLAFARHIAAPPSAAFAGLHPEFQLSTEPIRETATERERSFTYVLRPLRAGVTRVPAAVIETFDPGVGEYRILRSAPIPITVDPAPDGVSGARALRSESKPPIPLGGIRHNRIHDETMTPFRDLLDFFGRYWWAVMPLPPLVWLALRPLARHWDRCRRDPVYARASTALGRFRRAAGRDEDAAWRNYLADRLALCAEALTADTVAEALRARQTDADLVADVRRRFEDRDAAEYGHRPAVPSPSIRNLVRRVHKATVPLVLMWGLLLPSPGSAAESPDQVFQRALQMRAEKPDEAQSLFAEAALRFESERRFLNAGNSWFFAGENGRALANYRAAERRSPFDRQLQESIAFLRASRADTLAAPAATSGAAAAWWRRFCTWTATLRIGLFVLAYLFAWGGFLTAQLLGWRIRRAVWSVLALSMLVPLASVVQTSFQPAEGVIVDDAVARLGPSYAYDPAFRQLLHGADEFSWMETREGWVRARLPDGSEGWLQESACMRVE